VYNRTWHQTRYTVKTNNSESNHKNDTPMTYTNYLPFNISDRDYPPLCTSQEGILQLYKVSSISVHSFRRSWLIQHLDRKGDSYNTPIKLCLLGVTPIYGIHNNDRQTGMYRHYRLQLNQYTMYKNIKHYVGMAKSLL